MKILVALCSFALSFTLASSALAEHSEEHGGSHGGGHGALAEKMNAAFPQPTDKAEKREVPAKPELVAPAYFSSVKGDKVTLQWKEVTGADEYHIQVATDPNFKWLVKEDHHAKATSFDVDGLEGGKHYFWRVSAVKSNNWSTFRKSFFAMSMFETPAAATKEAAQ